MAKGQIKQKGGRTNRIHTTITPETRQKLNELLAKQKKSFADWLTEIIEEKHQK